MTRLRIRGWKRNTLWFDERFELENEDELKQIGLNAQTAGQS
jgi:hypothetical protein